MKTKIVVGWYDHDDRNYSPKMLLPIGVSVNSLPKGLQCDDDKLYPTIINRLSSNHPFNGILKRLMKTELSIKGIKLVMLQDLSLCRVPVLNQIHAAAPALLV